jgi:transcriptional regulator
MYIPNHFHITDKAEIHAFIEANAFGQLISTIEGRLFSTHIPVLLAEDGNRLLGHLAKANPQWQSIDDQEVLITLQGPHDYISPSWYCSPGVPTWNYQAVHIYGSCQVFEDDTKLKQVVGKLTEKFESTFDEPWQPDYKTSMLRGIVGIEVEISEIQCKYKLNQNRSGEDQAAVIEALGIRGSDQVAKAMAENQS